ncbi:hypothetical protein BH18GEM1_BH18GEM1_19450 [soil metagenome]
MPDPPSQPVSFEDYPLTRIEYITAMVHFYRGELARADAWRARLDPTTNWAHSGSPPGRAASAARETRYAASSGPSTTGRRDVFRT